jgi:hypothetical protein
MSTASLATILWALAAERDTALPLVKRERETFMPDARECQRQGVALTRLARIGRTPTWAIWHRPLQGWVDVDDDAMRVLHQVHEWLRQ